MSLCPAEAFSSQVICKYTGFMLGLNDLLLVKFISNVFFQVIVNNQLVTSELSDWLFANLQRKRVS
jgi:hypothetical protein